MNSVDLGQAIRIARTSLGLSQGEVADLCGVSQPLISAVERGQFHKAGPGVLEKIRLIVGVTHEVEQVLDRISQLSSSDIIHLLHLLQEEENAYARISETER